MKHIKPALELWPAYPEEFWFTLRLDACHSATCNSAGQAQEDLQLVKAYVTDVDRSEDAKGIINHTSSFKGTIIHRKSGLDCPVFWHMDICCRFSDIITLQLGFGHQNWSAKAFSVDHGVPDFEALVHSSRQEHVKLFFDTQKAAEAQKDAATKIKDLYTTLERSGTNLAETIVLRPKYPFPLPYIIDI